MLNQFKACNYIQVSRLKYQMAFEWLTVEIYCQGYLHVFDQVIHSHIFI